MKVTGWVSVLAILLGGTVGVGSSWLEYGNERGFGFSKPASIESEPPTMRETAGRARAQVDDDGIHDFGVMSRGETRRHTFLVRNTGTIPLRLRFLEKSCQCTDVKMSRSEVPPGEAAEIELSWHSNDYRLEFRQAARFGTNDPARLELDLTVKGRVQQIVRPDPIAVSLNNVLVEKSRDVTVRVFGYRDEDLEVQEVEFLQPETANFFQAVTEPLSDEELAQEPGAKSGSRVSIRLLPGLPIGRIHQQVRLHLNQDDLEPIVIPAEGAVVGNVTIVGPDYTPATGVLRFGTLAGDEPHERRLWLLVKGSEGALRVTSTDPPETLQASVGEALRVGNLTRQSLTVRVVPQGRLINRLGSQQGEMGRIVLESDSSPDRKIVVYVAFALEGAP